MKKFVSLIFYGAVLIFFNSQTLALTLNDQKVIYTARSLMQSDHISGMAVAVINHGTKKIYVFGNNIGVRHEPVSESTEFELGSVTKLMTTLLLAEEVQNNQVSLSDAMTNYLPQYSANPYLNNITLGQLATHTSNFPFNEPNTISGQEELDNYLLSWRPFDLSRPRFQYSNMGIGLLGDALCAQNNMSINSLMQRDIFIPLNMPSTQVFSRIDTDHVLELFPGAWAVKSNIADMSNFLSAAIGLPGTPQNILTSMKIAQTPHVQVKKMKQALGWQVFSLNDKESLVNLPRHRLMQRFAPATILDKNQQQYNPNTLIDKTGSTRHYLSYIAVIPGQSSGIVMLINTHILHSEMVNAGRKILFDAAYSI